MYSIGIDSGSTTTKGVLYDGTALINSCLIPTTHRPKETIEQVYRYLKADLHDDQVYTVTTGYGRELLPSSNKRVTEITCHGRGAAYLAQSLGAKIGTVIDIGGQDSKVIKLNDQQHIVDFLMNDKCAAGTGRFVEVIFRLLKQDLSHIDHYVAGSFPMKISSMCTVFAESEVIGLLADNVGGGAIALGVLNAIGERTANFARRLTLEGDVFFSGGLAQSLQMQQILETQLGIKVWTHPQAQYCGAIGAALIGKK